jgi:acetyl-CoA acetyltransferase
MLTRRYLHEYGATRDHLANVALAFRKHANNNPAAQMHHKPLTREQYMDARIISEPLCLFDNCLETDGALAVVIVDAERARDSPQPPALHPLLRPGPQRPAPDDDELPPRRPAARSGMGLRRRRCGVSPTSPPPMSTSPRSTTRSARSSPCHWRATASASGARAVTSPMTGRSRWAAGCRRTPPAGGCRRPTCTG